MSTLKRGFKCLEDSKIKASPNSCPPPVPVYCQSQRFHYSIISAHCTGLVKKIVSSHVSVLSSWHKSTFVHYEASKIKVCWGILCFPSCLHGTYACKWVVHFHYGIYSIMRLTASQAIIPNYSHSKWPS